ncbi:MAG: tRNA (guanosine(37)-N1)-methyltransferase TrmD [Candidatus Palauibacterales bacterium]|nr:tRNA (guanosine(37)-N1)-methyltransferase TrmD [Candidatus Palauibacterales bacterium]
MRINILTIFPEYFDVLREVSIPARAREQGHVEYRVEDLRDYTHDRHNTVDDAPYGGGAGMVMKPEPYFEAVEEIDPDGPIVLLTPRGERFDHDGAVKLSLEEELTLLCGHYKGVDERVAEELVTHELSIGDYVLSGGEPAALVVVDAVVRLLPGVLGDHQSAASDSFYDGELLAPPVYTRPPEYRGMEVPEVLRSGDHGRIAEWRREQALRLTRERRPDLVEDSGDGADDEDPADHESAG